MEAPILFAAQSIGKVLADQIDIVLSRLATQSMEKLLVGPKAKTDNKQSVT